jgi:hypothetical protein
METILIVQNVCANVISPVRWSSCHAILHVWKKSDLGWVNRFQLSRNRTTLFEKWHWKISALENY